MFQNSLFSNASDWITSASYQIGLRNLSVEEGSGGLDLHTDAWLGLDKLHRFQLPTLQNIHAERVPGSGGFF